MNKVNGEYVGLCADLLVAMSKHLNFRWVIKNKFWKVFENSLLEFKETKKSDFERNTKVRFPRKKNHISKETKKLHFGRNKKVRLPKDRVFPSVSHTTCINLNMYRRALHYLHLQDESWYDFMTLMFTSMFFFSYVMVEPSDGKWGAYDNKTGTWDGLVRQLQFKVSLLLHQQKQVMLINVFIFLDFLESKTLTYFHLLALRWHCLLLQEVDLAVAAIAVEQNRATVMDFSVVPMHFENSIIMIRAPGSDLDAVLVLFMKPFRGAVWLCIVASVFLCSLAVWFVNHLSPREERSQRHSGLGTFRHSLWTSFSIMVNQSEFERLRGGERGLRIEGTGKRRERG